MRDLVAQRRTGPSASSSPALVIAAASRARRSRGIHHKPYWIWKVDFFRGETARLTKFSE
jgi:hypothetical protein